jgi:pimeloyl-ACP methyl ester carboxylesterase
MTAEERLIASVRVPIESRTFDAGRTRSHCVIAGSGPAILLLHGLNIGWGEWYALLPALARRHKVIALDFPGSGRSAKIDFLDDDVPRLFLEAAEAALRTFAPEGAAVVGHSLGAWVGLKLAARRHPLIRSVAAVSPVGFSRTLPLRFWPIAIRPLAKLLATKAMPPTRANVETILTDVMIERGGVTPAFVDYVVEHVTRPPVTHPFLLIHRTAEPFRLRGEMVLSGEELGSIGVPVTVIHGALDPLIPLAGIRKAYGRIPGARLEIIDRCGHVPPLERPERFLSILEASFP